MRFVIMFYSLLNCEFFVSPTLFLPSLVPFFMNIGSSNNSNNNKVLFYDFVLVPTMCWYKDEYNQGWNDYDLLLLFLEILINIFSWVPKCTVSPRLTN